jgi:hypothetical protein
MQIFTLCGISESMIIMPKDNEVEVEMGIEIDE